jgi:transposase
VSAVTWHGDLLFHTYNGSFNATLFVEFLRVLVEWAKGRRLVIVLDGLKVHFAKAVTEAVTAAGWDIRFVQLPAYAPQLNPDEHVWSHLKGHRMKRNPLEADEIISDVVRAEMIDIARRPELVRSFFLHPDVQYLHADAHAAQNRSVN